MVLLDVVLEVVGSDESTESVEAAYLRRMAAMVPLPVPPEGDDAFTVLQWQQELEWFSDVNCLELGDVEHLERQSDVCEFQVAKRNVAKAGRRDERGEFVAEHNCLALSSFWRLLSC